MTLGVRAGGFLGRLSPNSFERRDAARTRSRDGRATRFQKSPLFLSDLLTGYEYSEWLHPCRRSLAVRETTGMSEFGKMDLISDQVPAPLYLHIKTRSSVVSSK